MSFTSRFFIVFTVIVAVCSANLATGRASLRPSAGKRNGAMLVGRTPEHYYRLTGKNFDNEVICNANTMTVLSVRYERLQEQLAELAELIDACEAVRAVL